MIKVGITGGIGSGKTTVCNLLASMEYPVFDADTIAKQLMNNDPQLVEQITTTFGTDAYTDGTLNRPFLAKQVFSNKENIELLNSLVHPRVGIAFDNWSTENRENKIIIKEAALLIESGSYKNLDKLILVQADEQTRIKRVLERDTQRSEADIKRIIANQLPESEKEPLADFIISNDGSQSVIEQMNKVLKELEV
ncbi:MAG: dephospho-CoA kinase [Cyclobacteriaceae bacterium]